MRTPFAKATQPPLIESLEQREFLSTSPAPLPDNQRLTKSDVTRILAAAASQALPTQVIAVVDRDGQILGIIAMKNAKLGPVNDNNAGKPGATEPNPLLGTLVKAITRARTGAFFESHEDAFSTRTARFIIQDHFPQPVPNTPGGPLYGVEFSSLPGSDVYSGPGVSGDPGGIPLFKGGAPVGGIGVAGDGSDFLVRSDLPYDPKVTNPKNVFAGSEEHDVDEQVALAGAGKFMAPESIRANKIFLAGLRFPFTADKPASGHTSKTLDQLIADGDGKLVLAGPGNAGFELIAPPYSAQTSKNPRGSPGSPYPAATLGGITGEMKNTSIRANHFGLIGSNDEDKNGQPLPDEDRLTKGDVKRAIEASVRQALITRAAIREPIGVPARVHVAVVDRDGDILGVFRMEDGTNFSFDVAVQKARTAAFFSDDKHAFTANAIGFVSQRFFPAGINGGLTGPMFQIQNGLSLGGNFGGDNRAATTPKQNKHNPLRNGITIFPGGAPLYKDGHLVGAIGVSGDGVEQDDIITYAGTKRLQPNQLIRSDHLSEIKIVNFLTSRVTTLGQWFRFDGYSDVLEASLDNLKLGLDDVQLPYVKFPRNPNV